MSYGAAGSRSSAQLAVLRLRGPDDQTAPGAGVPPPSPRPRLADYRLQAIRVLREDPGYVTLRLARRLIWLSIWAQAGTGLRLPASSLGSRRPEHNTVVGCGTRIEVAAFTRAGALVARDGRLEGGWTFQILAASRMLCSAGTPSSRECTIKLGW